MMKFDQIRKPLLISCLTASLALHAGAFYYFYQRPPSLVREQVSVWSKEESIPQTPQLLSEELFVENIENALEESLNRIATAIPTYSEFQQELADEMQLADADILQPESEAQIPVLYREVLDSLALHIECPALPPLFDPEASISLSDFALEDEMDTSPFEYQSEKYASLDLLSPLLQTSLPAPLTSESMEEEQEIAEPVLSPTMIPKKLTALLAQLSQLKKLQMTSEEIQEETLPFSQVSESTTPRLVLPNAVDYLREEWLKRSLADRTLPSVDYYGIEELAPIEWEEEIAADITYMPDPKNDGYVFSVTLRPDFFLSAEKLPQHFYFFIDRSNSVEKQKISRYKRAVQRALSSLNEEDTFNIVLFDKHVARLSEKNLPVNSKTIQKAQDFLERQQNKPTSSETYTTIDRALPEKLNPDEIHSVILISDGNSLMNDNKQKKALTEWLKANQGNVNFYTATSGQGNNLPLLDFLSYASAGKLLYSDTNAGFPRKLVRLVKDLHEPLVKNVTTELVARDSSAHVALLGETNFLPPMFANQPYTLIGMIDELCDFTLIIQGKCGERYLNIKKNISLKEAKQGGRILAKLWANSQATLCYERFLETGKNSHLKEAKAIVTPFNGTIALD